MVHANPLKDPLFVKNIENTSMEDIHARIYSKNISDEHMSDYEKKYLSYYNELTHSLTESQKEKMLKSNEIPCIKFYENEEKKELSSDAIKFIVNQEIINNKSLFLKIIKGGLNGNNKASDFHVGSDHLVSYRINGDMIRTNVILNEIETTKLLFSICNERQIKDFVTNKECDFALNLDELNTRLRVNIFDKKNGIASVFRTIPTKVLSMDDLGMGDVFKEIASYPRGMVLVTGPTGSGKSTTLAAIIDYINENRKEHILTIEDPVEFVHTDKKCLISQRELGNNTYSFDNALKAALRQDPDIILVGEMRDLETIRLALTAAETGHLVFGTLHTTSAAKTIDRIIDVFPKEEKEMIRTMLSESLKAVISQALIKRTNGGRVAAHEILIFNNAIKNLVRENKIAQIYSMMQTNKNSGMETLEGALSKLLKEGIIDKKTAEEKANIPEAIKN